MSTTPQSHQLYHDMELARLFATREENQKYLAVADGIDQVAVSLLKTTAWPYKIAELWWGAHSDIYDRFFWLLQASWSSIDWVDTSASMLRLAEEYLVKKQLHKRAALLNMVETDMLSYLQQSAPASVDGALMKYTINCIDDLDALFFWLDRVLKPWWWCCATIWEASSSIKSYSTNARFLYNGEAFPDDETRTLQDGDTYGIKFFAEAWNPAWWYMRWWVLTLWYHSWERIRACAEQYSMSIFLWDRKEFCSPDNTNQLDQCVMVIQKSEG